jgi:hypothetical protein
LCPSSRLSHSRNASAEIPTPSPRKAIASTSTELPSRRSRSSSSRCGSSCAVFDRRSRRAAAASAPSVGSAVGAVWWPDCSDSVVMWEQYAERCGNAMGVVLDQSKPRGLDVGVLPHGFLRFFAHNCRSSGLLSSRSRFSRRGDDRPLGCSDGLVRGLRCCSPSEVTFTGWIGSSIRRQVWLVASALSWFDLRRGRPC